MRTRLPALCPEECNCGLKGFFVSCYGTSLKTVPLIRLTEVTSLTLYANITLIERDSFVSLTGLWMLFVWRCGLRTIELGAFNGLTGLTSLEIVGNEISEIISGTFENLINLELLDLSYNELQHLDSGVFSGLVNINDIDLQGNKLQYLHSDTFLGLPNIKRISLRNNTGLQIPTDRNFITSHSLSHLDISYCNVSSVSVETFTNVRALELLDLRYNDLRTVHINILKALPKLSRLYLYGNRLQCDCQLQEVWRWCGDRNIETWKWVVEVPECDTPIEVVGMLWLVFAYGDCLHGKIQYHRYYNNVRYSDTNSNETNANTETDTDKDMVTETDTETETDTDIHTETDTDMGTENDTETETDTDMDEIDVDILKQYQLPVYALPFIFGTTGNVMLLIIIICNKDMRTVPNMYILNLAISDIIYLTVLFSEACANIISDMWLLGEFMCTFLPFCRRLSVGLSAYYVAVLSIQRYTVTVNPFHVRVSSLPTWRYTVATICGVWIVAELLTVPSVIWKYLCDECLNIVTIPYINVWLFLNSLYPVYFLYVCLPSLTL
jgi:hypothetical protein